MLAEPKLQGASNTRNGVDILGIAWIVDNRSAQHKCSFTAAIPQRMLARRRNEFVIPELALDLKHRELRFSVAPSEID